MAIGISTKNGEDICASCGTKIELVNGIEPNFCYACGEPINLRANQLKDITIKKEVVLNIQNIIELMVNDEDKQILINYIQNI